MKYRLGLDLGVGSIGSAVVELDEQNNPKNIVDAGVRIFNVSEGAEERRLKRTMRKNQVRTRKRLELLAQKLFENNLWVNETPEGTDKLRTKSPYKIRFDALDGKLSNPNYIGRAILHMAKHRGAGFVSASEDLQEEVLEEGEKTKVKKSAYDMMSEHLKETHSRTLGEFFYKRICEGYEKNEKGEKINPDKRIIRQKEHALKQQIVDYAIPRYLVKDEFNKFWDNQAQYFKQMQKEGLKKEIYNILFYEHPAAPYATGKCIYFRDEDRLLKAHPLSELRRIYEEVNNIRILSDTNKRKLTIEERNKIINELLLQGKNAGKQSIKKLLGLSAQQKISLVDDKNIKAYLYSRPEFTKIEYLQSLSDEDLAKFVDFLANPINPNDKNGRLYNEDELIAQLKPILKIDDDKEIGKLLTKLPKGRGMLGQSASKIILEKLKEQVITHREITDELAKTDKRFMASEEIARQNQGKSNKLPYYGEILQSDTQPLPPLMKQYKTELSKRQSGKEKEGLLNEIKWGKIANPAVHMILNQLRLVINDIIRIYGKPYDINIELGRDVGLSTKKKNRLEQTQKNNEKLNEEAKQYLKDHKLFINRDNILKYKLAKEQGWKDAYNPTVMITRNFWGFEVEHIIPQAKGGTDTYNNLCLVNRNDNLNKGDEFAYDYFIGKGQKSEETIREILKNARERTPNKAWRFEADAREKFEEEGDAEETTRYLTDTRYVSKMAARYLRAIVDCDDSDEVIHNRILPIKGAQTAQMRRNWNLQGLEYDLMGLNIPRYIDCSPYWVEQNSGEIIEGSNKPNIDGNWKLIDKEKNKEWQAKPRIDHRHHAMDAITVACMNRSMIQQMSNEKDLRHYETPLPVTTVTSLGEFRRKVIEVLQKVNVSHKAEHSKAGQLHKETVRKLLQESILKKNYLVTFYSKSILKIFNKLSDLEILNIPVSLKNEQNPVLDAYIQNCKNLKEYIEKNWDITKKALETKNKEKQEIGFTAKKITEKEIINYLIKDAIRKEIWNSSKFIKYELNKSLIYFKDKDIYFESGNNYCIDFYMDNQKICWEIINQFNINQPNFIPQWKKNNGKIIWTLHQNDIIELNTPEKWKAYIVTKRCLAKVKKMSAGISLIPISSSNEKLMLPDRGLSFCIEHCARKIELTPFGKIKKKHKVLGNGETKAA